MRRLVLLAVLSTTVIGVVPATASAAQRCPRTTGTLAVERLGRVWHSGRSLYACTVSGGVAPHARRMGPWTPGTRVAFDGGDVAWTTRVTRSGARADRLWAGDAATGRRWQSGAQAVPASGAEAAGEARVLALRTVGDGVAWVTDGAQLVLASQEPQVDDGPMTLDTPPVTLTPDGNRVLVGAWPDTPAGELARTLRLTVGEGEGDDCGGVDTFTATVRPAGASAPVGAGWSSSYSTPCG